MISARECRACYADCTSVKEDPMSTLETARESAPAFRLDANLKGAFLTNLIQVFA